MSQKIAIPWIGGIIIVSYTENEPVKIPTFSTEKSGVITSIAASSTYNIWASSDRDGLVKVWDIDGRVVREIQCYHEVTSIAFSNPRGDLLLGLRNQIAIVWMQDYLPIKYLRQAVTINFPDDVQESPKPFDSNLDFWDYFYEDERKKYGGDCPMAYTEEYGLVEIRCVEK
ncbi:hypothetical protein BC829DRAFT_189730 [Chytridium lagenaria]|nr:hypothetical protein BC829DRAFT_189730 [Chytridium lagenaria]